MVFKSDITEGVWKATPIGTIYGGTGLSSYTTGDIIYASASNVLSKLAVGSNGNVLTLASGLPSWSAGTLGTMRHEIMAVGDSITANGYYLDTLALTMTPPWSFIKFGRSGEATEYMLQRFNEVVKAKPEYVIILGGINDIAGGLSAATVQANLQAMYTAAHNVGTKVIALTILPFENAPSWSAGKQIILDAVNTWIMSTATNVDYRVDTYTALEDPSNADALKPTYDSGDGLHPNNTGHQAIAAAITAGVTFTLSTTEPTLALSGAITINQSLSTQSSPFFVGLQTEQLTVTSGIYPSTPMPVMGSGAIALITAAEGNMVYDVTNHLPKFYNGTAWTNFTTAWTIASGKTGTLNNSLTLAGTDGTTMTFPSTSATIARTDSGNTFLGTTNLFSADKAAFPTLAATQGQIEAIGSTAPTKRLAIGYNTTANVGFLQALTTGAQYDNLVLQYWGGSVGIGTSSPNTPLEVRLNSALTTTAAGALTLNHRTSGTAANGFGVGINYQLQSSAAFDNIVAQTQANWVDATHATKRPQLIDYLFNSAGTQKLGSAQVLQSDQTTVFTGIGVSSPTAMLHLNASTTVGASLRVPAGVAPTSPNAGDVWQESNHLYVRLNGVTYQLDQQSVGGSGITRSISSISSPTTAGSTASTDYVYFVSGTTTLTLPTAVGNTNRYTIKNTGVAVVTVATTSSQTIDGTTTITLNPTGNPSVDVISNNSNWFII